MRLHLGLNIPIALFEIDGLYSFLNGLLVTHHVFPLMLARDRLLQGLSFWGKVKRKPVPNIQPEFLFVVHDAKSLKLAPFGGNFFFEFLFVVHDACLSRNS